MNEVNRTHKVLMVRWPSMLTPEATEQWQELIAKALRDGVSVLGPGISTAWLDVPDLGGVRVASPADEPEVRLAWLPEGPAEEDAAEGAEEPPVLREHDVTPSASRKGIGVNEKRAILKRLQQYRKVNGLGCLQAVAAKAGKGVTPELLRALLSGDATLTMESWRRVGKALDKLGFEADGEGAPADG